MLKENSLVTDRATKSMEIIEKSHKEALAQVVEELEGKDNHIKAMTDLHEKDIVKKSREMRAVTEETIIDRKASNLVSQLFPLVTCS